MNEEKQKPAMPEKSSFQVELLLACIEDVANLRSRLEKAELKIKKLNKERKLNQLRRELGQRDDN